MTRLSLENLLIHAQKALKVYLGEVSNLENAFWVINPRDFHYLKSELDQEKYRAGDVPNLAGLPALVAHGWRKPPIIAMNIDEIEFINDCEPEPDG